MVKPTLKKWKGNITFHTKISIKKIDNHNKFLFFDYLFITIIIIFKLKQLMEKLHQMGLIIMEKLQWRELMETEK